MDWKSMDLPKPRNPRPQVGELGLYDYWRLVVASKLIKKSIAAILQTAVISYLEHNWEKHETRLTLEANEQGLTPEEMFMRYVNEDADK